MSATKIVTVIVSSVTSSGSLLSSLLSRTDTVTVYRDSSSKSKSAWVRNWPVHVINFEGLRAGGIEGVGQGVAVGVGGLRPRSPMPTPAMRCSRPRRASWSRRSPKAGGVLGARVTVAV